MVILSGADRLFLVTVAGISAPNWEKGREDSFCIWCFLFMDIASSALQLLKMFAFLGTK